MPGSILTFLIGAFIVIGPQMAAAQDGGGAPAGAGGGASAAAGAAASAPGGSSGPYGGGGVPAVGVSGSGGASPLDLNSTYQPGFVPAMDMSVSSPDLKIPQQQVQGGGGGGGFNMGALGAIGEFCMWAAGLMTNSSDRLKSATKYADELADSAYDSLDQMDPDYVEGADREGWGRLGSRAHESFQQASGNCQQKFITADGKLGPWGQHAMAEMANFPEVYESKTPRDFAQYCPKFETFDPDTRKRYWTWFFLSLASPESSCNHMAVNPNAPNGNAIGLYQLESPACARVGLHYSSRELFNPYKNISCAVAVVAKEMGNRDNVMTPTSRGPSGTYWGPMRNDDWNRARGGDIRGAKKMRALMPGFEACQ